MRKVTLLRNCTGLDTVSRPDSVYVDQRTGVGAITAGVNVSVREDMRLESSVGYKKLIDAENAHSLYSTGQNSLYFDSGSLCCLNESGVKRVLQSGYSGNRVCFCGYGGIVYFTSPNERGIVINSNAVIPWDVDQYTGPLTDIFWEPEIPAFNLIALHGSYMIAAVGNSLYSSEPGRFGLWDASIAIPFPSDIEMIAPVADGVYVSDGQQVWFLAGTNCRDFVFANNGKPVLDYPAQKWSLAQDTVEAMEIGLQNPGRLAVWGSPEGIVIAGSSGFVSNAIKGKVVSPPYNGYGAVLLRGYSVISSVSSEGFTTETNLKVGDLGSKATTQLSGFDFNAYCKTGELYLASRSDGIYSLGGNTLAGAMLETPEIRYGRKTRFIDVSGLFETGKTYRVGIRVDGIVRGKIDHNCHDTRCIRISCPRNITGDRWSITFESVDNGFFSIDKILAHMKSTSAGKSRAGIINN